MRILLLTHLYLPSIGGVQRSVHNLARLLQGVGQDVSVAAHRSRTWGVSVTRRDGLEVIGMNVPSPFTFGPLSNARRRILDAVNLRWLGRWCVQREIQLIHCNLVNVDTRYAFDIAQRTGLKVVITTRGGETEHWVEGRPHRLAYVREMLARADYVTAVSEALLAQARDLGSVPAERCRVVPNPVDVHRLHALTETMPQGQAPEERKGPHDPYFLFVGRLEPMKDVATLIDAYDLLGERASSPAVSLCLVGDGSLEPALRARARRGAGKGGIRFLGPRDYVGTLRLIRSARALVLPSRSSEGCPNVVLEAMAFGTPVIVSDLPALRELVAQGAAGTLFPRGDAEALSGRMIELLADPSARDERVRLARERVASRHRPDKVVEAYVEVYRRLVAAG